VSGLRSTGNRFNPGRKRTVELLEPLGPADPLPAFGASRAARSAALFGGAFTGGFGPGGARRAHRDAGRGAGPTREAPERGRRLAPAAVRRVAR
jgi:hypothetical protein